jgi:hypothetical protein
MQCYSIVRGGDPGRSESQAAVHAVVANAVISVVGFERAPVAHKKRDNAVGATRRSPLGRVSISIIGARFTEINC